LACKDPASSSSCGINALTLKLSIVPTRVDSSELLQLLIQVDGTIVFALIEAIWYYWFLGADDDASDEEDAEEIPEDADDAPEDFDAGLAGQNNVLVEAPVADADDKVVAVSAVRNVRDDKDTRALLVTLSWEVRASSATRDAASKIVELTPTLSWIEKAADAVADAARKIVELTPTLSWIEKAADAVADAASKIVELTPTLSWIERAADAADGAADADRKIVELTPTLSWIERAADGAADADRKIVELTPTLSWIEKAADGVADVARKIAEWPTCPTCVDHYLSEDADDNAELADQNDEQSEDPVAIVMIVAPPL
jgi:hypothetical protein